MVILLIVIGTSIWVFFDAKSIGVKKQAKSQTGKVETGLDMGPVGWMVGCLLLWIIFFPIYLCKRPGFKRTFQNAAPPAPSILQPNSQSSAQPDFDQQLRRLAKLKDDGIISQADFDQKKKEMLGM